MFSSSGNEEETLLRGREAGSSEVMPYQIEFERATLCKLSSIVMWKRRDANAAEQLKDLISLGAEYFLFVPMQQHTPILTNEMGMLPDAPHCHVVIPLLCDAVRRFLPLRVLSVLCRTDR